MKLWRSNKIDEEHEMSVKEISDGFFKSHYWEDFREGGKPLAIYLANYITMSDGLNSVFEEDDFFKKLLPVVVEGYNERL